MSDTRGRTSWDGLIAAVFTPMKDDGAVDLPVIERQCAQLIDERVVSGVPRTPVLLLSYSLDERCGVLENIQHSTLNPKPGIRNMEHGTLNLKH